MSVLSEFEPTWHKTTFPSKLNTGKEVIFLRCSFQEKTSIWLLYKNLFNMKILMKNDKLLSYFYQWNMHISFNIKKSDNGDPCSLLRWKEKKPSLFQCPVSLSFFYPWKIEAIELTLAKSQAVELFLRRCLCQSQGWDRAKFSPWFFFVKKGDKGDLVIKGISTIVFVYKYHLHE